MDLNREFLKTLGGILIIGVIVAATFLYGNHQRQDQINKQEQTKEQSAASQLAKKKSSKSSPSTTKSSGETIGTAVGGGTLPASTPRTGAGDELAIGLVAAGVGLVSKKFQAGRESYEF